MKIKGVTQMKSATNGDTLSPMAILIRMWETNDGMLPRSLARVVLKTEFTEADKARMHELAVKNQESTITPSELHELDSYIEAGDALTILKSKARRALKSAKAGATRRG